MRGEQAVLRRLILVALVEARQEIGQRRRRVPELLRERDGSGVGVELVAAVERVLEHHLVRLVRELVQERSAIRQRLAGAELHRLVLPDRVHGVLVRDVRHLVAEHGRQLRFVLDQAQARRDREPAPEIRLACHSTRYGPIPPCFSRATIATIGTRRLLLIGGTASIVGDCAMRTTSVRS